LFSAEEKEFSAEEEMDKDDVDDTER